MFGNELRGLNVDDYAKIIFNLFFLKLVNPKLILRGLGLVEWPTLTSGGSSWYIE